MWDRILGTKLAWFTAIFLASFLKVDGANVVIQIPEDRVRDQDGFYRLDYWPPQGLPPPNSTFTPNQVARGVELSRALPGTKYDFHLYYSNQSIHDWPTWTASITTVPLPPSNLNITVRSGKVATVSWLPPSTGGYSHFKLKVIPLTEPESSIRNVIIKKDNLPFNLQELTPGASYELQLYTVYESKESAAYISSNFTTRPNVPGRFIVWYRNETTMLILWQPPYPLGVYSQYRVSIDPPDAVESVLHVKKEGEPPGPAQAAFYGLVPGRAYNITVETVSGDQISLPTTAQYRTVPLRPQNVTFDLSEITPTSFTVRWEAPGSFSVIDGYQVSLFVERHNPVILGADDPRVATFKDLGPGNTFTVLVKTIAGNVVSWHTSANVTTRPLPVTNLRVEEDRETGQATLSWTPDPASKQDNYKIFYQDVDSFNGDSRTTTTSEMSILAQLYPGRNYSVSVYAISQAMASRETTRYVLTRPAPPIIEELQPISHGLNISWKSDVTSKQDRYAVDYTRNDTGEHVSQQTRNTYAVLEDLYPGAGYEIKVYAISKNELWSEPHVYFQVVYPNPVRNLSVIHAINTTLSLSWFPPKDSIYSHYAVRYRSVNSSDWSLLPPINKTSVKLTSLDPGEQYVIEVRAVSFRLESLLAQQVDYIVPPSVIRSVKTIFDSHNITFEWPRPEGRVDLYVVVWWNKKTPGKKALKSVSGDQATEGIDRRVTVVVGELMPGELYNIEIYTEAHGIKSEKVLIEERTVPVITSELTVVNRALDTTSFAVRYTATPPEVSTFDKYRFLLSDPKVPVKEKVADDTDRKVVFENLVPGRLYNITAWTVSGGVTSHPLVRQNRLHPEPVPFINATDIQDTSITLVWGKPKGDVDSFEISYIMAEDFLVTNQTAEEFVTLHNLRPHRSYTFTLVTLAGSLKNVIVRKSIPISVTFTTLEGTPGKVKEFEPVDVQPNSITFRWSLPVNEKNGVILGYVIEYYLKGTSLVQEIHFGPEERHGTVTDLIPGLTYIFKIQARTRIGLGDMRVIEQRMPIEAPPKPSPQVVPTEMAKSATTITIRYRQNYFSNANGRVVNYTIIVSEDIALAHGRDVGPHYGVPRKWKEVQKYSVWPAYQAVSPYFPFNSTTVEDFVIGSETDCDFRNNYCNGPLKPGTVYRVKIRAYTSDDKYSDTIYSDPITTEYQSNNTAMAIGVSILVIVILVLSFVLFSRWGILPWLKRGSDAGRRDEVHSFGESIIETSRPVKLKDFVEHYRYMAADSDFRFSEEYEALKHVGRGLPCQAAELAVNRPKNRFTNILPYDHSRVKLQPADDDEGSDYINANYVPGFTSPREFVVTQGPLVSTRDDFWRMCWETNSKAIVMLTRCVEKGREKCDHYWPYDTKAIFYGDIQVQVLNESHYPDWTISEFRIQKGDVWRIIRHFHFTTWPDFGVPDPPQTLVRFVRAFRERVPPEHNPIVVHCSAGVGRSGTFIALDRILQSIKTCDYVDIFGIVYEMRRERVWMVQNEQQYICIHQCLLAVLEGRENEGASKEIHDNHGYEDDEGIAESGM